MAETLYLTPAGTPPLSPAQAPRKRKTITTVDTAEPDSLLPKKVPKSREPKKTNQTKSRNGCHTCKAKRLKCDETKPKCNQCIRRNVECEGYKKEFKWRDFPEQNVGRRLTGLSSYGSTHPHSTTNAEAHNESESTSFLHQALRAYSVPGTAENPPPSVGEKADADQATDAISPARSSSFNKEASFCASVEESRGHPGSSNRPRTREESSASNPSQKYGSITSGDSSLEGRHNKSFESILDSIEASADMGNLPHNYSTVPTSRNPFEGRNLHRKEWPKSRTSFLQPSQECDLSPTSKNIFGMMSGQAITGQAIAPALPQQIEPDPFGAEALISRFFTTTCSVMSIFPSTSTSANPWHSLIWPLVRIDGQSMLYHALMSMACFHSYQSQPSLRLEGTSHMRKSLEILHKQQHYLSVPIETTLATCMALAFSESWMCWKKHIRSGSSHIKTAKQCLMHALAVGAQTRLQKKQLRFLCKTYLYVDVIARLTSVDDDFDNEALEGIATKVLGQDAGPPSVAAIEGLESIETVGENDMRVPRPSNEGPKEQLDPLMGCASTLFPIIGRVANLVRRVYRQSGSGLSHITEAQTLSARLNSWTAPSSPPSSLNGNVLYDHTMLTATTYRFATLLHLHQSIPELLISSSLSTYSMNLGMRILQLIARIPPTSGTVIVHIYPLLVGGCEAKTEEDRDWVRDRWRSMEGRMGIGNVEKAREVVEGVWERRDTAERQAAGRPQDLLLGMHDTDDFSFDDLFDLSMGRGDSSMDVDSPISGNEATLGSDLGLSDATKLLSQQQDVENRLTVRGDLHWVGVMKDWGWEVLLG